MHMNYAARKISGNKRYLRQQKGNKERVKGEMLRGSVT